MHIQWYATLFRGDMFADAVAEIAAPVSLKYGATRYTVQRSRDDITGSSSRSGSPPRTTGTATGKDRRCASSALVTPGKYQVPITYVWHDEYAAGGAAP